MAPQNATFSRDGEVDVQAVAMAEQADARADQLALGGQVEAEHGAAAALERQQPGAQPQQAGLAGTVGTAQQDDLAHPHRERGAGERREPAQHGDRVAQYDRVPGGPRGGIGWSDVHGHGHATWHDTESGTAPEGLRTTGNVGAVTDQLAAGQRDATPERPEPADTTHDADPSRDADGRRGGSTAGRISKWDRPPEPHDWRFFVGNLGRVLIATGLLMFGFVAYQLWGTGIETARAQGSLESAFEQQISQRGGVDPLPGVDDTSDGAQPPGDESPVIPDDGVPPVIDAPDPAGQGDRPVIVPTDLSDEAVVQDIPVIVRGDALARLQIPRIDKDLYVVAGVSLSDLKDGPGHYPDTPLPGQLGNAAIAGHRTTYGAPFFDVDQLAPGDELIVTMVTGDQFVYVVTGVEVVSADDYWVVSTRDPDIAELTLTSCHPKYTARDRIVVHSVLDPSRSSTVGVPTFYGVDDQPAADPIPGDDPVVGEGVGEEVPATTVGESGVGQPATATTTPGTPSATTATAPVAAPQQAPPSDTIDDAFIQGWFDDGGAFPQIALWGAALAAIALGAYAVSRRFRHDAYGFVVGIVPFLTVLYFFFQNVNRLLPPGI